MNPSIIIGLRSRCIHAIGLELAARAGCFARCRVAYPPAWRDTVGRLPPRVLSGGHLVQDRRRRFSLLRRAQASLDVAQHAEGAYEARPALRASRLRAPACR